MKTNESPRLDDLKGWSKLEHREQQVVRNETKAVAEALDNEKESKLEAGKHLIELRKILQPHGMFLAHIAANFRYDDRPMGRATAYRYMDYYTETSKKLSKPVLEIVMRRGYRPEQMKLLEDNPPPKTSDPVVIRKHLDKLERRPREVKEVPESSHHSPDTYLKEVINFAANRYDRLPRNARTRTAWVTSLIGMLLTRFGWGTAQTFEPMAIPDKFKSAPRGRPKLMKNVA